MLENMLYVSYIIIQKASRSKNTLAGGNGIRVNMYKYRYPHKTTIHKLFFYFPFDFLVAN